MPPRPAPGGHSGAPHKQGIPPYDQPCLRGGPNSGDTRTFRPAESRTRTYRSHVSLDLCSVNGKRLAPYYVEKFDTRLWCPNEEPIFIHLSVVTISQ